VPWDNPPVSGCCGIDFDAVFTDRDAQRQLAAYRRTGPSGSTARLIGAIRAEGIDGATVLDIGGGVGVISHELLAAGASRAIGVDASQAYVAAARGEATRRGFGDRSEHRYGDFVALAADLERADVVTLDAVICCYPDMPALVGRSVERARRLYGLVYPRDRWWLRLGFRLLNLGLALLRKSYRAHIHSPSQVDRLVRSHGLEQRYGHKGIIWQTTVYRRT
jgi:hypothetical protein